MWNCIQLILYGLLKKILFTQNEPLSNSMQKIFHLVDSGLTDVQITWDGKKKLCLRVQNYHQLHLPPHIPPKGNCQSQSRVSAEVWRRWHLSKNYLPLLSWLVHKFYKKIILQSFLQLCGRNQFFWIIRPLLMWWPSPLFCPPPHCIWRAAAVHVIPPCFGGCHALSWQNCWNSPAPSSCIPRAMAR